MTKTQRFSLYEGPFNLVLLIQLITLEEVTDEITADQFEGDPLTG